WSLLAASSFFCSFFSFLAFFLAAFFSAFSSFLVSVFLSAVPASCCANDTDDSENVRATANNSVSSFFIVQTLLKVFVRILLPGGGSTIWLFPVAMHCRTGRDVVQAENSAVRLGGQSVLLFFMGI